MDIGASEKAKLFVGMLGKHCTESDLQKMFQPFGSVVECAVLRDPRGVSKGCAFVTLPSLAEAEAAITTLHQSVKMQDATASIVVKLADTDKQKYQSNGASNNQEETKLFIGMIGQSCSEDQLRDMLNPYGTVTECTVLRDSDGNSRGCGFARMSTHAESSAAIQALNGSMKLPGASANIVVKFADSEKQREQRQRQQMMKSGMGNYGASPVFDTEDTKLFIGMLGDLNSEDELREMFKPFGEITDCAILRDKVTKKSKGCGFIRFSNKKEAYTAIRVMNGSSKLNGATANIVVKYADNNNARNSNAMGDGGYNSNHYGNTGYGSSTYGGSSYGNSNFGNSMMNQSQSSPMGNNSGLGGLGNNSNAVSQLLQQQLALAAVAQAALGGNIGNNSLGNNLSSSMSNSGLGNSGMGNSSMSSSFSSPSNYEPAYTAQPDYSAVNTDYQSNQQQQQQQSNNNPAAILQQALAQQQAIIQQALGQQFNTPNPSNQSSQPSPPGVSREEQGRPGPEGCNLFVMHLPRDCGDQQLKHLFTPFGNVLSANVFFDKITHESKCFGFVSFDNPTSANNSIKSMNGFQIGGRRLKVQLKTAKKPY